MAQTDGNDIVSAYMLGLKPSGILDLLIHF